MICYIRAPRIAQASLLEYLDSVGEPPEPTEQMVRGYKVRTVQQAVDPKEAETLLICIQHRLSVIDLTIYRNSGYWRAWNLEKPEIC